MGLEIAFYGKGGIGKSTVSSNVSYALSSLGKKVIQIGCDPKHDSTRGLTGGRSVRTVLDMVRTTKASERTLDSVLTEGSGGVKCIEAGGPEPGIGCAGKGILTMFQTLSMLSLDEVPHDYVVYDVLGDVVCGGFAVPMRPDYSDVVFIVSSGEFMSVYAANNIMKAMVRFGSAGPRLAGIIFNSRGSAKEDSLISEFSRATGIPIVANIPRSGLFEKAESAKKTVSEMFPDSREAGIFRDLALHMKDLGRNGKGLFEPRPLTDEQLDTLVSEGSIEGLGDYKTDAPAPDCPKPRYEKCSVFQPAKRIGMGPIAAAITADKVTDIPVVIHGTKSCGYSMLNELYLERLSRLSIERDSEIGTGENMFCSDVDAITTIFGGTTNLEQLLEDLAGKHRVILVIITCLTNMIGDDVESVVGKVTGRHPGVRIGIINGNNALEGVDAHMEVLRFLADLIDITKSPAGNRICILDDNHMAVNRGHNGKVLSQLMRPFGKTVGRGFINDCTLDDIINLKTNDLVIPAENTDDNMELAKMVRAKGVKVAMRCLPMGYRQGCEWMEHMGKMFSNKAAADRNLALMKHEYESALREYSENIRGRRVAIIQDGSESTGWIEETLSDAGAGEITVYSMGRNIPEEYIAHVCHHDNYTETSQAILDDGPDLVIGSGYALRKLRELPCLEYPHTTLAHAANIGLLRLLSNIFLAEGTESWKNWGSEQ